MKKLTQRQKQAISTKLKITEVAMDLFRTHGYCSVKIQDICKTADVSVGAFYHYFKSKDEIFNTGYMQVDILLEERVEAKGNFLNSEEEILLTLGEAGALLQELNWNFVTQAYKQLLTEQTKYTLRSDRFLFERIQKAIESGIEKNELISSIVPIELTSTLLRVSRGAIFDWCLHQGNYNLKEKIQYDVALILSNYLV